MYFDRQFSQCIFLFGLLALLAAGNVFAYEEIPSPAYVPAGMEGSISESCDRLPGSLESKEWYLLGTTEYHSWDGPVELEYHFKCVAERLDHNIHWLFEDEWRAQTKKIELGRLSQETDEHAALKIEIDDEYRDLIRRSECFYEYIRANIIEYVDPCCTPREISWRLGVICGLFGHFQKDWLPHKVDLAHAEAEEGVDGNSKALAYYKVSLLNLAYSMGLIDRTPSFILSPDLDGIVADPAVVAELDPLMLRLHSSVDEGAWIEAMRSLNQQQLEHACWLFRIFSKQFLESREAHPSFYVSIAARLSSVAAKMLLEAQTNASYNLDAINHWMFKLYIDLRKWEAHQQQDEALETPDLQLLIPEVAGRCLKLMPAGRSLVDVTEENEYAICGEVRQRNLIPSAGRDDDRGRVIVDEFEFSPYAMRWPFISTLNFFLDRATFLRGYCVNVRYDGYVQQQIYNYLSGFVEIDALPITKDNAMLYLKFIKIFDIIIELWNTNYHVEYTLSGFHFGWIGFDQFYFPRSSYELRKLILKLCPHLNSYEALMYSVNPDKVRDEKELPTRDAWVEEAETIRQLCIDKLLESARYLSDRMEESPLKGVIIGTRGVSGAGKSTFLKKTILPLLFINGQGEPWEIDALAEGILNPDTIKAALRDAQGGTLNTQIHNEGASAFQEVLGGIADKNAYILDKRHLTSREIMTNLVEPAKERGSSVWLFDFDISLTSSLSRILARPLDGADPCPEYEVLVDGILSARRYRSQVIDLALREETVAKYELYATGKQILVAYKLDGALSILDQRLFDECVTMPSMEEVEEEVAQVIDDAFIDAAIARGDIRPEQRGYLEQWRGMTLKESVRRHVQGAAGSDTDPFEPVEIAAFDGSEWLADLPDLRLFLECEHRLHVRGVDDFGRGLHWESEQLDRGVNPRYNPEAAAPGGETSGIQMNMGYFIVPKKYLDQYVSDNLTPAVARELVVYDDHGDVIGFRFFVHPEAYQHYVPLLHAGITFVPPSTSEYIGAPTSSYNSWVVRRVTADGRKPFIVKMGTPNGPSDIKHLLAGDDIVRCLSRQKRLDKITDSSGLLIFKEVVGFILENIPGYPAATIDSGMIVSEIPDELLNGECRMISMSALISCERIKSCNRGIASFVTEEPGIEQLPVIYELMQAAISSGAVSTPNEFLKKYFIEGYLSAIEQLVFQEGYSLVGQAHNLYVMLNPDNTIRGFAYRDLGEMGLKESFLESFSWSYRYASMVKLLSVITCSDSEEMFVAPGCPTRSKDGKAEVERSLYYYLASLLEENGRDVLERLSLTQQESLTFLNELDEAYMVLLKRYFSIDEEDILTPDGTVPCAEKGSADERELRKLNKLLWDSRLVSEQT